MVAIKKCFRIFDKKLITKRCLREIKLLQHFNGHPRIINLRAMDIVDYNNFNEVYLIQDCCDTTMADIIHSRLQLEPVHYQWFMYQIFTGLKFIHSANVSYFIIYCCITYCRSNTILLFVCLRYCIVI